MKRIHLLILSLALLACQFGCAALEHRNLETQLQLQQSVFISPDAIDDRPVYLRVSNQTGKSDINFDELLVQKLAARGYKTTKSARDAGIRFLVNFLYLDKARKGMSMEGAIAGGFGGAIIGGLATGTGTGAAVGATAGATAGGFFGLLVTVDTWYGIVDVQIEEPLQGTTVRRTSAITDNQLGLASGEGHKSSRGTSSSTGSQTSRETSEMEYSETVRHKKTQTRIVVEAVQTNIDEVEASKQIREQLADSIANFL